jgi:hypothetical protein
MKAQREASQQAALVDAQDEVASAKGAVARIESQIVSGRQEVGQFTSRFNEFKSRQDELTELDTAYKDAVQRRAKLDASERARMPTAKLIEAQRTEGALAPAVLARHGMRSPVPPACSRCGWWRSSIARAAAGGRDVPVAAGGVSYAPSGRGFSAGCGDHSTRGADAAAAAGAARSSMRTKSRRSFARPAAAGSPAPSSGSIRPDEVISLTVNDVDLARRQIRVGGASGRDVALS